MDLDQVLAPAGHASLAAIEVAREYASPALFAHSVRSFVWGAAYAEQQHLDFDVELFHVAALLHDLGLTAQFDNHDLPFEVAGGHVARVFAAGAGWPAARRDRLAEVIERHMWPSVDPKEDLEGHLLEVGTSIDISGTGVGRVPPALVLEVDERWPRLDLATEFYECFRQQSVRKPTSRAADLVRAGIGKALRENPLENPAGPGGAVTRNE
jgi:hypothetical protein